MQDNVVVGDSGITGTLHYVTDYTQFSDAPEQQKGNYLALKFDFTDGATVTVEIVGGTKGAVTLDDDKNWVGRIANKDSQSIKVIATKGDQRLEKTYSLTGLVLESAE